jgi:hypothetical protein
MPGRLYRLRVRFALPLLALSALALGAAPAAAAAGEGVVGAPVAGSPADTLRFWDREAMESARPLPLPPAPPPSLGSRLALPDPDSLLGQGRRVSIPATAGRAGGASASRDFDAGSGVGYPNRVHGKLFFTNGGRSSFCSAQVVNTEGNSVVFTAAHCLYDRGTGQWSTSATFVPGYRDGARPYGRWVVQTQFVPTGWITPSYNFPGGPNGAGRGHPYSYDFGVAILYPSRRYRRVEYVGSRGIQFNTTQSYYGIFGYPVTPAPYNGQRLIGCNTQFYGFEPGAETSTASTIISQPCYMSKGSSGGGWINANNQLISVESHGYCEVATNYCGYMYGPYFEGAALSLFNHVRNLAPRCPYNRRKGRRVCPAS